MASEVPTFNRDGQHRSSMNSQTSRRPPSRIGTNEGSVDEYIVPVKPQTVAPVDEEGLLTTHRALNANQVSEILVLYNASLDNGRI